MWCKIEGCENYIENQDTGLCGTHGREARKQSKPQKIYRIPTQSKKKSKATAAKIAAYKKMDDSMPHVCSGCGSQSHPLSHSHIIPVSQHPEFEATPENIVYDCLSIGDYKGCHDIWEHGSEEERKCLNNYNERISVIKKLCLPYFKRVFTK